MTGDQRPEWQPIETAPTDGTPVLIFENGEIVVAKYTADQAGQHWLRGNWRGTYGDGEAVWHPTHWMPLPEEPK